MLDLLLEPVTVALPAGMRSPVGADLRAGLGAVFGGSMPSRPALALDVARPVRITRHDWRRAAVNLPDYVASGLPTETMGRSLAEDPLFFGAALAGGIGAGRAGAEAGGPGRRRRARRGRRVAVSERGDRSFEPVDGETVYDGLFFKVRIERFRHADGEVVTRELVRHQGAVGMLAYDGERVWLVRQPREASTSPTCWRSRPGAWTWMARSRWRRRGASWPRRWGSARGRGSRS